jgi:3',5'-cyclic AMP phosphodiesterase CpdA
LTLRIAHVSDIHITSDPRTLRWRECLGNRAAGWFNLRCNGRYARFEGAAEVARAFVADVLAQGVEAIIVSGDITGMSLEDEWTTAREILNPLRHRPEVLGIPGNHDVYVLGCHSARPFSRDFGAWERSDRPDLAGPPSVAPYPLIRFLDPAKRVCALAIHVARPRPLWDSSGCVGATQFAALRRALSDPSVASTARKLLVVHYAPLQQDGTEDTWLHGLRDTRPLLELCGRAGVDAILHGHIHERYVHPKGANTPVNLLCVGSLTDSKHERAYHIYELDPREPFGLTIKVRRFDTALGAFAEDSGPDQRIGV